MLLRWKENICFHIFFLLFSFCFFVLKIFLIQNVWFHKSTFSIKIIARILFFIRCSLCLSFYLCLLEFDLNKKEKKKWLLQRISFTFFLHFFFFRIDVSIWRKTKVFGVTKDRIVHFNFCLLCLVTNKLEILRIRIIIIIIL